jgi:hypothetical protein
VFRVKFSDTILEVCLSLVLVTHKLVKGVNKLVSKFIEGFDDFTNGALVGEVLLSCKGNKGLDDWGEGDVVLELGLDVDEVALEFLDLDE